MIFAIVLFLLIIGSVLFHFLSPWYFTPVASNWGTIDDTITITFWVTGFVFVAINLFMVYCVIKFRRREGNKAQYQPENKKLEIWLTALTTIGVAALLAPGLFVWSKIITVPEDAAAFEAVGQQWHWTYRFPGKDGELGTFSSALVSDENPYGLDPDDPNGQDDILIKSNVLHLPVDQPVKALLRSKDVLHNFSVAQFRMKMDLVPGLVTYMWFTPTVKGRYDLLCEELCGIAHFAMRGHVVVEEEEEFQAWLAGYPTFAESQSRQAGDPVAGQANYAVCCGCHGTQGEGNVALNAPKLSGQHDWYMKRQLMYFKQGVRGYHDDDTYGKQMVAMANTLPDETAIDNVLAYINTLPDNQVGHTIGGDEDRGKSLFRNCAACHGNEAQGIQATNATRLSNMSDWYLARQLKNFKNGIRGAHLGDMYGPQMALMSSVFSDDDSINDLVAYINSL
jgi:cytochrome c oxidase subunit 2